MLKATHKTLAMLCCSITTVKSPLRHAASAHCTQVQPVLGDASGEHRSIRTKRLMMWKLINGPINMMYAVLECYCM